MAKTTFSDTYVRRPDNVYYFYLGSVRYLSLMPLPFKYVLPIKDINLLKLCKET